MILVIVFAFSKEACCGFELRGASFVSLTSSTGFTHAYCHFCIGLPSAPLGKLCTRSVRGSPTHTGALAYKLLSNYQQHLTTLLALKTSSFIIILFPLSFVIFCTGTDGAF
jgi:hypothetical protein